jgi:hypothetical protein
MSNVLKLPEPKPCIDDAQGEACVYELGYCLGLLGRPLGIVSIGPARILYPQTTYLDNYQLLVMEKFPEQSFNYGSLSDAQAYAYCVREEAEAHGLDKSRVQVQCSDIADWEMGWFNRFGDNPLRSNRHWLFLLDTYSLHHLYAFYKRVYKYRLPKDTILVFNSNDRRNPDLVHNHARRALIEPHCLGQVEYYGRGAGGPRLLSFFQEQAENNKERT